MTDRLSCRPEHGWTCFHCGETLRTERQAREHFGNRKDAAPGCTLDNDDLLAALRDAEDALERERAENVALRTAKHLLLVQLSVGPIMQKKASKAALDRIWSALGEGIYDVERIYNELRGVLEFEQRGATRWLND